MGKGSRPGAVGFRFAIYGPRLLRSLVRGRCSVVPAGLGSLGAGPGDKSPGYFRMSLRGGEGRAVLPRWMQIIVHYLLDGQREAGYWSCGVRGRMARICPDMPGRVDMVLESPMNPHSGKSAPRSLTI